MKKFKQLADQINLHEGEHTFGGGFNNINQNYAAGSAYSDEGVYQIEKKSQLNRINAFLDAFSRKEYMDPRAALGMLRAKLNIAGLDFVFDKSSEFNDDDPEGQYRFQIKRFGGAFGVTPDHDVNKGFQDTDGIEDPNGEFHLTLNVSKSANGAYHLETKIDQTPHVEIQAISVNPTGMDMGAPADPANILRVANALAGNR
jgi:hypothetical protein